MGTGKGADALGRDAEMIILVGVLLFGLLIFVHELGHFLAARLFGIRVHEFSIGMGPAVWKKEKGGVLYSLRLLPVGGYVKLLGEDESSEDAAAFGNKHPLARMLVLFAGGFMNIIAGLLVFLLVFSFVGETYVPEIDRVVAGSPAEAAGLMPGDVIVEIDGSRVHIQNDVTLALMKNGGKETPVTVRRGEEKIRVSLTPAYSEESGGYILGFYPKIMEMTPALSVKTAFYNTSFVVKLVIYSFTRLISGGVKLSEMAGPVGIVSEMQSAASSAMPLLSLLNFMGLIAVNLGVMNLLPIPALDGGRIFFILVELIRRKPIKPEHEGFVHFIGFALLMLLMVLITFSDIQKLFA